MCANLITLAHFSTSSETRLPKSAGEPASTAQLGYPRVDFPISEGNADLLVELVDDFSGCVSWGSDSLPAARFVTRQEVPHGRNIWQHLQRGRGGHGQRAKFPGSDVFDRLR